MKSWGTERLINFLVGTQLVSGQAKIELWETPEPAMLHH